MKAPQLIFLKNLFSTIVLIVLILCLMNCQSREKKNKQDNSHKTNSGKSTIQTTPTKIVLKQNTSQQNALPQNTLPQNTVQTAGTKPTETLNDPKTSKVVVVPKATKIPDHYKIFYNLTSLLHSIKIGHTETKEELIQSKKVPDDALKIVKSITKVSDNELDVKWKSKWMVEKISDVELKDGRIKLVFDNKNGIIYTSGDAIGIECNDVVYTKLTIKGDRAYIPTIKKYSWKIGR